MAVNFQYVSEFKGYRNKRDQTNLGPGYLVSGSENIISTDGDLIAPRRGYTVFGATNTTTTAIESEFVWETHRGTNFMLRSYDDELEFVFDGVSATEETWTRLADGWSAVDFEYATYWDTTESQEALLFVNGDSNIYYWSGGVTTFASATATTITKEGTTSWGEEGFLTSGTRSVEIGGITYTYTGGEGTTTLTGVAPDPTLGGHSPGDVVIQSVRTTANKPASGTKNDLIAVLNNQVYIGQLDNRQVYVSAVNDYTDYSFTSPRLVGEGALLTIDAPPRGFVDQDEFMYISAGTSRWYQVGFILSGDQTAESILVDALKSTPQTGALNQAGISKIKNNVVFITNEPSLDTLGRIKDEVVPQTKLISDPIKKDFDTFDFTNCDVKYFRNNLYIALPAEGKVLLYNLEKGFWETPQTLPIVRFSVYKDRLYGHSNAVPETYELFVGFKDREVDGEGGPIQATAAFSYQNFGQRFWQKNFIEWATEGYITENTTLTLTLNYDFTGSRRISSFDILGNNSGSGDIIFNVTDDISLGKNPLGSKPLGTTTGVSGDGDINKFRVIKQTTKQDFYEIQAVYSSYGEDQRWELLAFGPTTGTSTAENVNIKEN